MINLKERRISLDLTMADVAKAIGVSEATVSRYESGNIKNMRRDRIEKYAQILKVSPAALIGIPEGLKERLKTAMLKEGYAEGALEDALQLPISIADILNGREPTYQELCEIANVLHINPSWLLGNDQVAMEKPSPGTAGNGYAQILDSMYLRQYYGKDADDVEVIEVTHKEKKLLNAYRNNEGMQPAIDKLLGL